MASIREKVKPRCVVAPQKFLQHCTDRHEGAATESVFVGQIAADACDDMRSASIVSSASR